MSSHDDMKKRLQRPQVLERKSPPRPNKVQSTPMTKPLIEASPVVQPNSADRPSIRQRYATEGVAPQVFSPPPHDVHNSLVGGDQEQSEESVSMMDVLALVQDAVKDSSEGEIHLHLHAPVHLHLGKL